MRHEEKLKVCFILPEIAADTATHFMHKWELMQELKDKVVFFTYQPTLMGIAKIKFAYFFRGCRIFYVHYSFKGALVAILFTKFFGGRVYYWNCGMPWLYRRSRFEEGLFRFILRHTIFVTGTEKLAGEYGTRYGLDVSRVRVVPNHIRVLEMQKIEKKQAREQLHIPVDKKVILFLHHLSRRKGAHLLPEIIKEFSAKGRSASGGTDYNNVLFLVVGEGPEKSYLVSCISYLGMEDIVHIVGAVPNYKIPQYMAVADVYLMPSEEEGMPNALLEAMAAGVPFIASNVGAVREMTPSIAGEFVLPYGDTHAFADKIKKLLADEELREKISFEEREWVKRYDVSIIAPRFLELFQEAKKVL